MLLVRALTVVVIGICSLSQCHRVEPLFLPVCNREILQRYGRVGRPRQTPRSPIQQLPHTIINPDINRISTTLYRPVDTSSPTKPGYPPPSAWASPLGRIPVLAWCAWIRIRDPCSGQCFRDGPARVKGEGGLRRKGPFPCFLLAVVCSRRISTRVCLRLARGCAIDIAKLVLFTFWALLEVVSLPVFPNSLLPRPPSRYQTGYLSYSPRQGSINDITTRG